MTEKPERNRARSAETAPMMHDASQQREHATLADRRVRDVMVAIAYSVLVLSFLQALLTGHLLLVVVIVASLVAAVLVIRPQNTSLLALAALAPFAISLPIIYGVPILGLVLALGLLGVMVRITLLGHSAHRHIRSWDLGCLFFYLCLIVLFAVHPALPGAAIGMSQDITGFRSWLDHAMGAVMILFLGSIINSRVDVKRFFRWLPKWALILALVFIPLMFIKAWPLSVFLYRAGVYVSFYGNGLRRFVFLPALGSIMIIAAFLPTLFSLSRIQRQIMMVAGIAAMVAGGNRSSVIGLMIQLAVVAFGRKNFTALATLLLTFSIVAVAANVFFQSGSRATETPIVRVMTTFNPELARASGSLGTLEWRVVRWKRAIEDIQRHPWLGLGYGGLKGYFSQISGTHAMSSELAIERDLATGSTHNGYISAARALGIPITLLFGWVLIYRIYRHWRLAARLDQSDTFLSEAHLFFCSYLAMTAVILAISAEIRNPTLWLMIAMGIVVEHLSSGNPDHANDVQEASLRAPAS